MGDITEPREGIRLAPWDDEFIEFLKDWQTGTWIHPYTCVNHHNGDRNLIPTRDGWVCPHCDYKQNWAHDMISTE